VLIAFCIGAVDHVRRWRTADSAFGYDRGVDRVDRYRYPIVKDIAIAFKILALHFLAVFDDASM
jgi:hypothetical protein